MNDNEAMTMDWRKWLKTNVVIVLMTVMKENNEMISQ
jgi:hypothetical protein